MRWVSVRLHYGRGLHPGHKFEFRAQSSGVGLPSPCQSP